MIVLPNTFLWRLLIAVEELGAVNVSANKLSRSSTVWLTTDTISITRSSQLWLFEVLFNLVDLIFIVALVGISSLYVYTFKAKIK